MAFDAPRPDAFQDCREALICGCLALSLGYGQRDSIRCVFEDVLPQLRARLTDEGEQRLAELADRWLRSTETPVRLDTEMTIRLVVREKFLWRMLHAHDRHRNPVPEETQNPA